MLDAIDVAAKLDPDGTYSTSRCIALNAWNGRTQTSTIPSRVIDAPSRRSPAYWALLSSTVDVTMYDAKESGSDRWVLNRLPQVEPRVI